MIKKSVQFILCSLLVVLGIDVFTSEVKATECLRGSGKSISQAVHPSITSWDVPAIINKKSLMISMRRFHFEDIDSICLYGVNNFEDSKEKPDSFTWHLYTSNGQCFDKLPQSIKENSTPWVSPPNVNIYATFACQLLFQDVVHYISQIASISVVQTLGNYDLLSKIKWPNDVVVNNKKISGIGGKTEITNTSDAHNLFVYFGLNVNMLPEQCNNIDQPATSMLVEKGRLFDKEEVLTRLSGYFYQNMDLLFKEGWTKFESIFLPFIVKHAAFINEEVIIKANDKSYKGIFLGPDRNGFARLLIGGSEQTFNFGHMRKVVNHPIDQNFFGDEGNAAYRKCIQLHNALDSTFEKAAAQRRQESRALTSQQEMLEQAIAAFHLSYLLPVEDAEWYDKGFPIEEVLPKIFSTPIREEGKPTIYSTPLHDEKRTQEGYEPAPAMPKDKGFAPHEGEDLTILLNERKEWEIKKYDKVVKHAIFGKFYRTPNTDEWWTKDKAGHGGSAWKKFKENAKGLQWEVDVDKYGKHMKKHKSEKGKFIPWDELNFLK